MSGIWGWLTVPLKYLSLFITHVKNVALLVYINFEWTCRETQNCWHGRQHIRHLLCGKQQLRWCSGESESLVCDRRWLLSQTRLSDLGRWLLSQTRLSDSPPHHRRLDRTSCIVRSVPRLRPYLRHGHSSRPHVRSTVWHLRRNLLFHLST